MITVEISNKLNTLQQYLSQLKTAYSFVYDKSQPKSPSKDCPRCFKIVFGEKNIEQIFGHRTCNFFNVYPQSWCKECVSKRIKETLESLNHRRQLNKFFIFLVNNSILNN